MVKDFQHLNPGSKSHIRFRGIVLVTYSFALHCVFFFHTSNIENMEEFLKCNQILSHAFAKTRPLHSFRLDALKKFPIDTAGPYCTF